MENKNVNCRRCNHFYITWDKLSPYGCRSMGFKSKVIPSVIVTQTTGKTCLSFHPKPITK